MRECKCLNCEHFIECEEGLEMKDKCDKFEIARGEINVEEVKGDGRGVRKKSAKKEEAREKFKKSY